MRQSDRSSRGAEPMTISTPAADMAQTGKAPVRRTSSRILPLIEEKLQVGRRAVDLCGYRISKQVHSRVEVIDELLSDQRVQIERRPIGRLLPAGEMPVARHEGSTWVIPVVEEVLVTLRQLVLVEEVRITTVLGSHRDPQHLTLHREEVSIERLGPEQPAARNTT